MRNRICPDISLYFFYTNIFSGEENDQFSGFGLKERKESK